MTFYNKLMGSTGGLVIGAMMLLVTTEVINRLFLNNSIEGSMELVGIGLALAVFFGLSPCEEKDKHVKVELIVRLLPEKVSFIVDITVYLLAISIVSLTAWQVGIDALSSWKIREALPGVNVQVPVYPARIATFIGYLAFCFQLVVNFISKIKLKKSL